VPGAVAEADGEVQALGGEIDLVVMGAHPHVDQRPGLAEDAQARQQPAHGEGAGDADGEDLAHRALAEAQHGPGDAVE
jgi:hypothetical protein